MSKAHRGRPLKKEGMNRGTCPITGLTGVKLLYDHENEKGETIKISKAAHAKFKNIKKAEEKKNKAAAAAATPAEEAVVAETPAAEPAVEAVAEEAPAQDTEAATEEAPAAE